MKAKKSIRVRSQHDALLCVWWKQTIWSMSGVEASARRDALDLAEEQFGAKS